MAAARDSSPGMLASFLNHAPKRDVDILVGGFEFDAHTGADLDLLGAVGIHAAQDSEHTVALIEVDVGGHERCLIGPPAKGAMLHGKGVDPTFAAAFYPLDLGGVAIGADESRIPVDAVAAGATGKHQLPHFGSVPERLREWTW